MKVRLGEAAVAGGRKLMKKFGREGKFTFDRACRREGRGHLPLTSVMNAVPSWAMVYAVARGWTGRHHQ